MKLIHMAQLDDKAIMTDWIWDEFFDTSVQNKDTYLGYIGDVPIKGCFEHNYHTLVVESLCNISEPEFFILIRKRIESIEADERIRVRLRQCGDEILIYFYLTD